MDPIYATVDEFWQLALSIESLFQDQSFEPGPWTSVSKIGVGTGSMDLTPNSNPKNAYSVKVVCDSSGELNLYGVFNPGPFPSFRISLNNGISFSHPLQADTNGKLAYQKGGFSLVFTSGITPISFVIGDEYSFQTTASPDLLLALEASSREMDPYFRNQYNLPLSFWDLDVKRVCCQIARWNLIERRGLDKGQDFEVYYPKRAYEWLHKVSIGEIRINVKENGSGILFPQFGSIRPPYRTDWRY